jgi:hypothetical protein
VAASSDLERGREAHERRAWRAAYDFLSSVDAAAPLEPADLQLLATSAYMLGRDSDFERALERAHHAYLDAGEPLPAVRCAFWCGMSLFTRGEIGPGSGWIGRAQRLLEREEGDVVERGYLLMPLVYQHEAEGEFEQAAAIAAEAASIAERFGDADGFALSSHAQGTCS